MQHEDTRIASTKRLCELGKWSIFDLEIAKLFGLQQTAKVSASEDVDPESSLLSPRLALQDPCFISKAAHCCWQSVRSLRRMGHSLLAPQSLRQHSNHFTICVLALSTHVGLTNRNGTIYARMIERDEWRAALIPVSVCLYPAKLTCSCRKICQGSLAVPNRFRGMVRANGRFGLQMHCINVLYI
nr:hypothetical protein CFP56_36283 [Quercus suber]